MAVRMTQHLAAANDDLRFQPTRPRVRALSGGDVVADSTRALLVWEPRRIVPMYAVPEEDLRFGVRPAAEQRDPPVLDRLPPVLGPASFERHTCRGEALDVLTSGAVLPGAGFRPQDPDLAGAVVLDFAAFESWLVEDEPRVGHPHDPFKRISVHACSRRVEVSLEGTLLASSDRTQLLLETHLPPRYYFPPEDVRLDLLEPSEHRTTCAYKGHASYFSLPGVAENICWHYDEPLDDALRVKGYLCFWAERTDHALDGEPQPRPVSPFSSPEEIAARGLDEE